MSTTLTTLLEQKRRQLVQIQEEIATLERAQALLAGRPVRPTGPAAVGPRPVTIAPRPASTASRPAGTRPQPDGPSTRTLVLDLVRASATPLAPRAILAKLAARGRHVTRSRITSLLAHLRKQGVLRRTGPGLYALASSSATPAAPPKGSAAATAARPTPAPRAGSPAKPAARATRARRR